MGNKVLFLLCAALLLISSCKKEEQQISSPKQCNISLETYQDNMGTKYVISRSFDSQGMLATYSRVDTTDDGGMVTTTDESYTFVYQGNTILINAVTGGNGNVTVTLNSQNLPVRIVGADHMVGLYYKGTSAELDFVMDTSIFTAPDTPIMRYTPTYANGNITSLHEENLVEGTSAIYAFTYYTNKANNYTAKGNAFYDPYDYSLYFQTLPKLFSKNLIKTMSIDGYSADYTYDFDAQGVPLKSRQEIMGAVIETEYQYDCD